MPDTKAELGTNTTNDFVRLGFEAIVITGISTSQKRWRLSLGSCCRDVHPVQRQGHKGKVVGKRVIKIAVWGQLQLQGLELQPIRRMLF